MKNGAWSTTVIIQVDERTTRRFVVVTSLVVSPIVDKLTVLTTIGDDRGDISATGKLYELRTFIDNKTADMYAVANETNRSITQEEAWEIHTVAVLSLYEMHSND